MKTIYLDSEFKCHTSNDGTLTVVETDAFNSSGQPLYHDLIVLVGNYVEVV